MPKKQRKTRQKSLAATEAQTAKSPRLSRRDALTRAAWIAGGGLLVAGGGTAFAMDFRKKLAEADLTQIGNGTPSIVQIHDPQCSMCMALQKETRAALKSFHSGDLVYMVANIRSVDGASFQARMGLPHVTLVMFDAAGRQLGTVEGVTPREQLVSTFSRQFDVQPKV